MCHRRARAPTPPAAGPYICLAGAEGGPERAYVCWELFCPFLSLQDFLCVASVMSADGAFDA